MKTRVIKVDDVYYPQYLKTWWFSKWKKWCYYTYDEYDCLGTHSIVNIFKVKYYFSTKLEALHFIKKEKYGI